MKNRKTVNYKIRLQNSEKNNKKDVDKLKVFVYNKVCVAEVSKIKYNRGVAQLG